MAKNIKFLPVVLFFYTNDITQAEAETAQEYWDNVDVHYRLNANGNKGDIIENFDGLAGKPPANYVAAATAGSKPFVECTMTEITAGTAGKFDGLTSEPKARMGSFSVPANEGSNENTVQGVQAPQTTPLAAPTAAGTVVAPPAGTINAPVEGDAVVTQGNPSTTTNT